MKFLIGVDIGTSGTKTIIMSTKGKLIASDLQVYDILTPGHLCVEQWPAVWENAVIVSIREVMNKSSCNKTDVAGMCISGLYGGSGIPLDESMRPVRPCIIWMDRRAIGQESWVCRNIGKEKIYDITHNGTDPYYGYIKMLWIRDNEYENWRKIKIFLPPNAYVIYKLTGEIAIDYSSAGNLGGVFDIKNHDWSKELMAKMDIPANMFPERLVESSDIVGNLTNEAASMLLLQKGTPVCAGGVDCAVATLGLGVFEPGKFTASIGTSMCASLVHEGPINAKGLIEMPYVKDAKKLSYSFGGAATAGALVKWFRDNFAQFEKHSEMKGGPAAYAVLDRLAEEIPAGSEGLVLLPYFMGERSPIWDTNARGSLVGMSLSHTRGHIYRAFLEGIAYSLRQSIEATDSDVGESICIAGGAAKSALWKQIIADVTGKIILSPREDVEANLGDVILAGVGTGCFLFQDVRSWQIFDAPVFPDLNVKEIYDQLFAVYKSVYRNLKEDFACLVHL